jgi:D-alanyl-D-alanine dipeptidase
MLLADVTSLPLAVLPTGIALPPITPIPDRRQPCDAVDEPLHPISGVMKLDAYQKLGILPARNLVLRKGVLARLGHARRRLPPEFDFVVLDAWRSFDEQRSLLRHYSGRGPTKGFVASVDPDAIRPPHTTGGALDLTLSWRGLALALGSDFDSFTDDALLHAFEAQDSKVRRLRRMLAGALHAAGFAPYELEWWHWSYGDDVWAAANHRAAIYDIHPFAVGEL